MRVRQRQSGEMGHRFALIALVTLALAGTACGGSDDGGRAPNGERAAPAEEALTREAFVAQAKAICLAADEELPPGVRNAPTEEQLALALDVWSAVVRQLRDLEPPPAEEARVDRMLTYFENAIEAGKQALAADDESMLAAFAGLFDQASKGAAIANSYGLDVCSPVPVLPPAEALSENKAYQQAMLDFIQQVEEGDLPTLTQP